MMSLKKGIKYKNIFFDFDGVIAESVNVKTQAFKELYLPYGENIANQIVDHHIHNGGVSRYEKFKIYHNQFLGKSISEDEINDLAKEFSRLVLQKVINSDEVLGSTSFLNKYSSKLNFWIVTGTPSQEIEIIVAERKIRHHFIELYGSPKTKDYWTEHILKKHSLKRDETLFLGDATTDYEAAKFSRLHFALREHEENKDIFMDFTGLRFKTFIELEEKIQNQL